MKIYIPRNKPQGSRPGALSENWEVRHGRSKEIRRMQFRADDSLLVADRSVYERSLVADLSMVNRKKPIETLVQSPYSQRYLGGYYFLPGLRIVAHETSIERITSSGNRFGPGSVIHRLVRIEDTELGGRVEIGKGSAIEGSEIGDRTRVKQNSRIRNSHVGANGFIAQGTRVDRTEIGAFAGLERHSRISGASIGSQASIGQDSTLRGPNIDIGDSFTARQHLFVGGDTVIGDQVSVGSHCHIAGNDLIGAESEFGNFVRVARGIMLASPTYAENGEFIRTSNSPIGNMNIGDLFNEEQ
jgi:carbonic anhydrase/acetyltransferase-like protein (isoleucine patch superfamily)